MYPVYRTSTRPDGWGVMSPYARARWLRWHGLRPPSRPAGECLTEAWGTIPAGDRDWWVAVVEAEALAVTAAAEAARARRRDVLDEVRVRSAIRAYTTGTAGPRQREIVRHYWRFRKRMARRAGGGSGIA